MDRLLITYHQLGELVHCFCPQTTRSVCKCNAVVSRGKHYSQLKHQKLQVDSCEVSCQGDWIDLFCRFARASSRSARWWKNCIMLESGPSRSLVAKLPQRLLLSVAKLPDIIAPQVHQNDCSYVRELSRRTFNSLCNNLAWWAVE